MVNNSIFDQVEYNKKNTDLEKMIYVASCIKAVEVAIQNLTDCSQALKNNKINEALLSLQEKNGILENDISTIQNNNENLTEQIEKNELLRKKLAQLNDDIANVHTNQPKLEAEIARKKLELNDINTKMIKTKAILDKLVSEYESAVKAHSQHVGYNKSILDAIGSSTELDSIMIDISTKLNVLDDAIKKMREERKKKPISELISKQSEPDAK